MSATVFAADLTTQSFETSVVGNGIEYQTVYDEANNTVQAIQRNVETGEYVYGPIITVGGDTNNTYDSNQASPRATKIHQDTFLNFEYDIWETSPREWNLERPNDIFSQSYFMVYENNSNKSELRTWKSDVDALNAQEFAVIGGVGLSVFEIVKAAMVSHAAIASGGILTAAAVDSIKEAAVVAAGTAVGIGLLCSTYNNCALSFEDVLNYTDNIHY